MSNLYGSRENAALQSPSSRRVKKKKFRWHRGALVAPGEPLEHMAPAMECTNPGEQNGLTGVNLPPNVRFTACPNTCLFADGCSYQVNGTMIENQPNYYDVAMTQLYTKYDAAADSSGSNGLCTRRKDFHQLTAICQ